MLDDLKMIHERDPQDALGVAEKQWEQLRYTYNVERRTYNGLENVVLAGMGGSAFPGLFLQSWPGLSVPFEIVRNYSLPRYVNENTLFIASSYSGNTEETLSALTDAEQKGAQIVVTAAGGELHARAKSSNHPLITIPGGIQPRMSSFYFIAAFVNLLSSINVVPESAGREMQELSEWLKDKPATWRPDVPTDKNPAKQLALELAGKSVIIYSGPLLAPAANKMKICLNENAKNLAWWNQLPEFNHNEFVGWSSHPVDKPFAVVDIRSNLEHERVQKRFEVSERLLSGKRPHPEIITPMGNTIAQQLFWTSMFGDFVSIYVALLNGVNPTPVDLVEKFKIALTE